MPAFPAIAPWRRFTDGAGRDQLRVDLA